MLFLLCWLFSDPFPKSIHLSLGIDGGLIPGTPVYTQILIFSSPIVGPPYLWIAHPQIPPATDCKHSTRYDLRLVESVDAIPMDMEGQMYVY